MRLVVLDLDGTLVDTTLRRESNADGVGHSCGHPDGGCVSESIRMLLDEDREAMFVHVRPGASRLLFELASDPDAITAIWSAGTAWYVAGVVHDVLCPVVLERQGAVFTPAFVWSADETVDGLKNIDRALELFASRVDEVVLVDDREEQCAPNERNGHRCVQTRPYSARWAAPGEDGEEWVRRTMSDIRGAV